MKTDEPSKSSFAYVLDQPTRVLAVDDDPIQLEFASVYLATPTTTIDLAADAEAGLKLLSEHDYDIALIDIDMPGMGGLEMVRAIRSSDKWRRLPVVMVTGSDDIITIDKAFAIGATSFVVKPVNWRVLSYHLRFVLRAQRTQSDTD